MRKTHVLRKVIDRFLVFRYPFYKIQVMKSVICTEVL